MFKLLDDGGPRGEANLTGKPLGDCILLMFSYDYYPDEEPPMDGPLSYLGTI